MSKTEMMDGDRDSKRLAALEKALGDESADPTDLPLSLLKAITANFSEAQEIGRGGFGAVYKGVLRNGTVAVKKLFTKIDIQEEKFVSEIGCLMEVKHRNTVRFLGYCSETQDKILNHNGKLILAGEMQRLLCFEYLPKGSLAGYLSDASSELQWTTRFQIIKGVCEGVHYLHQQRIIHMDLKPENVLLDENMVPKIADFGLSRRFSERQSRAITENKAGTWGYMAPEFLNNGEITFKTDVYSLGVIIMEILMGRHKRCSNVEEAIESWANMSRTTKSHTSVEQVKACAEIGIKCTNDDPGNRPTWDIISGILGEAEISNCSVTSDVATSTEEIRCATELVDELKSMDVSAAPSQLQTSALEVEQEDSKVSKERKGKAAIMSVGTGVMNALNGKLTTLMCEEYNKLKQVRKQASVLEKELSNINAALEKLELTDELAPLLKNWRDDVRDISYDMENCIVDFMRQFGGEDAEVGFVGEVAELHKRLCELHRIASQMEELRTLVVEANARRESYKIDDCKLSSGTVAVDPRLPALYQEAASLVGIDGPREEVATWLMDAQKKLKVVFIVGFGGLGKTTLAKQVYDQIGGEFNCKAFISVSQRPNMRVLLSRLRLKLGMKESSHDRGFDDIIEEIRECLKKKTYLVVVDDLWDQSAWNIISCAFPEDGNGSRIIVTTRLDAVASTACHSDRECIHRMEPLNEQNSRMLFYNRVFGSEVISPPYLEEVAAEILNKCGGLPLAIITIACILATQARSWKHWVSIRNSLGAQSGTSHPSLEEMRCILKLSYMHLPLHLRACFLYLGIYPEDHEISRNDLVRQWIAEGFVSNLHGRDLEDVATSYFNELINRNMIQPCKAEYGEVLSCRVHDMMLDLILSKCAEDNFLSVVYNSEDMARLHGCKYKVRRLSLRSMDGGSTDGTASLLQVRSFSLFGNSTPPLVLFKYLRVLIFIDKDIFNSEGVVDLTAINQLFQLRYLKVSVNEMELPAEIEGLVYLETLDLGYCSRIWGIPSEIVHLPRLSYLSLPYYTAALAEGIGSMKSLRTLKRFDLEDSSVKGIVGIGELTNMRELSILLDRSIFKECDLTTLKEDALACSIGKLHNLKRLRIFGYSEDNNRLGSLSNPFPHIEVLRLKDLKFRRVPKWMGGLHCLRFLELSVEETSTEEVHLLGELPSLVHLWFRASHIPKERATLGAGLFPVLEYFGFLSLDDVTEYLEFEAGAMPNLRTLMLWVWRSDWDRDRSTLVGMEHLLRLQQIDLDGSGSDYFAFTFWETSRVHPNHPSVIKCREELEEVAD